MVTAGVQELNGASATPDINAPRNFCRAILETLQTLDEVKLEALIAELPTYFAPPWTKTIIDSDDVGNDRSRTINAAVYVMGYMSSLLLSAHELPTAIKKKIGQTLMTHAADIKRLAEMPVAQPAAHSIEEIQRLLPPLQDDRLTVQVVSLQTLLQGAHIGQLLYSDKSDKRATAWENTCGFYSVFHLVNAWVHREKPEQLVASLTRDNFSKFVGLLQSCTDAATSLTADDLTAYPTIRNALLIAATRTFGHSGLCDVQQLLSTYAFLLHMKDSPTLRYTPCYYNKDLSRHSLFCCDSWLNQTEFNTYMRTHMTDENPFVFPLIIGTEAHVSCALIYKVTKQHYIVFFAESNQLEGHINYGMSAQGEGMNFKSELTKIIANLTTTPEEQIAVVGTLKRLTKPDLCILLNHYNQYIKDHKGTIYDFALPHEEIKLLNSTITRRLIAQEKSTWLSVMTSLPKTAPDRPEALLFTALYDDDQLMVEQLLKTEIDTNAQNSDGNTPLHVAIQLNKPGLIRVLLAAKANTDMPDHHGNTPLQNALQVGNHRLVGALLDAGADPTTFDHGGMPALHRAIKLSGTDDTSQTRLSPVIRELLANDNVDPNALDRDKNTPLHLAVQLGNHDLITMLLDAGANPNQLPADHPRFSKAETSP